MKNDEKPYKRRDEKALTLFSARLGYPESSQSDVKIAAQ